MAEINTDENASGALDEDQMDGVSRISSSHVMWQNLGGPSPIQRTRLNHNDLKPGVSS